jgi:hypothetical protein
MARREERAYREYGSDEQRRQPGCPARELCDESLFRDTMRICARAAAESCEVEGPYGLLRSGLHDVWRERNPERLGDLLVEHQLLDRDFLERDVARLLTAQYAREDL